MANLDRLVTFTQQEEITTVEPGAPGFMRRYQVIISQSYGDGISSGHLVIVTSEGGITDVADASDAIELYLSTTDEDGESLPSEWPPNDIQLGGQADGNGIRYSVISAEHPTYRDRYNRVRTATDTWRLTLDPSGTNLVGTGLAAFGVLQLAGHYDGTATTATGTVTHRIWASRRDPSPRDEIAEVADFSTVPVTSAVWRFRAEQPYPTHEETFTDDKGEQWEVFGIRESDARGRFVDALCSAVVGPSS